MTVPSFTHVADHPHIRAIAHELATNPAVAAIGPGWNEITAMMQRDAERSHRAAAMIMHEFQATKRPFGLYLRSFEAESYQYFSPDVVPDRDGGKVTTTSSGATSVEKKLAAALDGRLAMLAVANPSQLMTARADIPRLQLPNEGWQQVVQNLVAHAHLIVMDCDTLAPGVIWELETIANAARADATIVILPSPGEEQHTLQDVAEILGAVVHRRAPVTKEDPRLAGHRRVAYESDVDFDRLESSPLWLPPRRSYSR
jgi:hypothetical protein